MRGAIIETLVTVRRLSGILLLAGFALNFGGVVMYSFGTEYGWVAETPAYHARERGLFMVGYVAAALGVALLEPVLSKAGATILPRLVATAFPMATVVVLVMEALSFAGAGAPAALVVLAVLLLFGAEVLLGGALLVIRLVPAWIGWATVAWNVAWPVVLAVVSPGDPYYPVLHAIPLLVIGIPLVRRAG